MPIPDDLAERLRTQLLADAAQRDWLELWPDVVRARVELLGLLARVDAQRARAAPADDPDGWSIHDTLRHLHHSSIGVRDIITDLAAGRAVRDGSYEWAGEVTAHELAPAIDGSFAQLLEAFRRHSIDFARIPGELPDAPDLDATFPHMYFGEFNCRTWFIFQALHDGAHSRQLRALIESGG